MKKLVDIIMKYEARTLEYDSNTIFVNCKRFSQHTTSDKIPTVAIIMYSLYNYSYILRE